MRPFCGSFDYRGEQEDFCSRSSSKSSLVVMLRMQVISCVEDIDNATRFYSALSVAAPTV